ncbi:heme-binding protein [Enterococcus casseliflavus]|uniref:heme-binding protein n=1 Tax=Enterococcus casseliflavus TaxID=37734 RepID=UPI0039A6BED7
MQFAHFDNDLALRLVIAIDQYVKRNYPKPVGIKVVHQGLPIIRFLMAGRKESQWLERKERTVLESGHSSLYVYAQKDRDIQFAKWAQDEHYAICGGGFPIIEDRNVTGAICVSGLAHLEDHKVITEVLKQMIQEDRKGEAR